MKKVIRSICFFSKKPTTEIREKVTTIDGTLRSAGYEIQTKRLCSPISIKEIGSIDLPGFLSCVGTLTKAQLEAQFEDFILSQNVSCNIELCGQEKIDIAVLDVLFELIRRNASKTFHFSYVFRNRPSSPYFPSASYLKDGFSIGLQSTDLSEGCTTLEEWLYRMYECWREIEGMFGGNPEFLGIDSSIAPLFSGGSSLINLVPRLSGHDFVSSTTTDFYLRCTKFLKTHNPRPVGLCGIMFPCLEDVGLAEEYEKKNFPIERNVFLSLHSGLGIDVYPIGIDEDRERVYELLCLLKGLAEKYDKPLSARFVSDGKAKIGQRTNFLNPFLTDVQALRL